MSELNVLAVVGNPRPASRTRAVAEAVAARVASGFAPDDVSVDTLELCELGPHLLGWGAPEAKVALDRLLAADVLVIASPTYKGTYTGLLKLLLDQVGAGQLVAQAAIPVLVGGAPDHSLAVDGSLRPVLLELGASCPTAGLFVLDSELDGLEGTLDAWAAGSLPRLVGAVRQWRTATG